LVVVESLGLDGDEAGHVATGEVHRARVRSGQRLVFAHWVEADDQLWLRSAILVAGYLRRASLGCVRSAPQLLHDLLSVLKTIELVS
jgi:hypothetical protein